MTLVLRPITRDDADIVTAMAQEATQYLVDLGDSVTFSLTRERFLADGFGAAPAFGGFVAFADETPVGYLLHCPGYDADKAQRLLWVIDLFVRAEARGLGAGQALMRRAQAHCRAIGGRELLWAVYRPNRLARDFYDRFGGHIIADLDWMAIDA